MDTLGLTTMSVTQAKISWIFDLDGTLTEPVHDFDAIRAMLDLPRDKGILEAIAALPAGQAARVMQRLDDYEYDLAGRARASQGAGELLDRLAGCGAQVGIVTRNNLRNTLCTLATSGLGDFFVRTDLITRENGTPKPSPSGIRALLRRWSQRTDTAIMVGNHRIDLEAGRAAGTATALLFRDGHDPCWSKLADVCVYSLTELVTLTAL